MRNNHLMAGLIALAVVVSVGGGVAAADPSERADEVRAAVASDGSPASDAVDPANQPQSKLVDVASRPNPPRPQEDKGIGNGSARGPVAAPKAPKGQVGCVPQYGEAGQCLPLVPPSQSEHVGHRNPRAMSMAWSCQEARLLFPDGIALTGRADPLGLDSNKDGTACGVGDRA